VVYPDQLVDCFLKLDIPNDNKFDIKYTTISNLFDISEDKINDNYTLKLVNSDKLSTLQFKPLFKKKDIDYSIYISFDERIDLSSVPILSNLKSDKNKIYIFNKVINSDYDFIKYELEPDISSLINKNWLINVLEKEQSKYNIIMSYDVIEGSKGGSSNGDKKEKSKLTLYLILIIIFSIAAIIGISFGIYYLYILKQN